MVSEWSLGKNLVRTLTADTTAAGNKILEKLRRYT